MDPVYVFLRDSISIITVHYGGSLQYVMNVSLFSFKGRIVKDVMLHCM